MRAKKEEKRSPNRKINKIESQRAEIVSVFRTISKKKVDRIMCSFVLITRFGLDKEIHDFFYFAIFIRGLKKICLRGQYYNTGMRRKKKQVVIPRLLSDIC